MNPIKMLRDDLIKRFPDMDAQIDAAADATGLWQLDLRPRGGSPWVVVEWKPDTGFGVSTPGVDDYGTKPDELYPNAKAAYNRVVELVVSGGHTAPPAVVRLAELRRIRNLSQAELAARAGVGQAAIARIENRQNILVSTLHRVVAAMGGTLSIRIEFPDGAWRELTGFSSAKKSGS
jgi:DNA-binding Xre family transcriptional regulator